MRRLSDREEKFFYDIVYGMEKKSRLNESKKFIQHGKTSVYDHSIHVAYSCFRFIKAYNVSVEPESMIKAAVLHDYFLYDWHDKNHNHKRPHGLYHPGVALKNAKEDFLLSEREQNAIKCHMFPLTLVPPRYKEGIILCIFDKICSLSETINRK